MKCIDIGRESDEHDGRSSLKKPQLHNPGSSTELVKGQLGIMDILFTLMALSATLALVVVLMPLVFSLGNDAGLPDTWLLAIVAMPLFALGYVRMIPHVRNPGAFYAYCCKHRKRRRLGRRLHSGSSLLFTQHLQSMAKTEGARNIRSTWDIKGQG
jgi:hypothetical protein